MHINDFFDNIYLVNLDRRTDRLEKFKAQADKFNIKYERISAVDGSKLNSKPGRPPHIGWSIISMGNYGNVLSQRLVIEDAINKKYDSILILEDDAEFCQDFNDKSSQFLLDVPNLWDMVYFGGNHQIPIKQISNFTAICNFTLTAHAVGIKSHLYEHIIHQTEDKNIPIDLTYAMLHKIYNVYCPVKPLIWQSSGFSDIEEREVDYSTILQ